MRLYYSKPSAFSRKVRLAAAALGISDKIELVATNPTSDRETLQKINPLDKIPVLMVEDRPIFDSSVICRYLDLRYGPGVVMPRDEKATMAAGRLEALGDGIIEAGMLLRAELMRAQDMRDGGVEDNQRSKVLAGLDYLEANTDTLDASWSVGQMAVASALGWLEFRLADQGFLEGRPPLAAWYQTVLARSDMQATRPDV